MTELALLHDLLQEISQNHLEKLEMVFKKNLKGVTKSEFFQEVETMFTEVDCFQQIISLFDLINKKDKIRITWSDFLDFMLKNVSDALSYPNFQLRRIVEVPQTKRETVVKIVLIETEKYFCYAMVSKHGKVGIYDGNLNFLTTYQLIMTREDIYRKEEERRRRNRWVTDAIFCADVLMFIVTNTARSVVIYEASGLKHVPLWLILSTPNIVQCFTYKSSNCDKKESVLYMGDDKGTISSFVFMQPTVSLLRKKHNDKISLFYWGELREEKDFLLVKKLGKPHQESIRYISYFEENESLVTCSRDNNASLVITHLRNRSNFYIFKMLKGCNCFFLSKRNKMLFTGSQNGVLRIWNPLVTSKPIAILVEHKAAILDIKAMEFRNLIISCSSDAVIKIWNVKEEKCIQTLTVHFSFFTVLGKLIEWGTDCLYPGPKRSFEGSNLDLWNRSPFLFSCCNHLAVIKVTFPEMEIEQKSECPVLLPPPLQNSVLVPKMWKTSDDISKVDYTGDGESLENAKLEDSELEKKLKDLEFILERDLFADNFLSRNDINFKIATLEKKKLQMKHHVELGAPYLALDLHEVHDLQLTPGLPVPNRKRIKATVEKIEKILQDASCKDIIFSEPSTSRSRSSRSSFVEFD